MLLLLLALWSMLLLAWLILHWAILPHIDDWRPDIERHASAALGLPVTIARIEVRSAGWIPALALQDVRLSDRDGHPALHLPLVSAAVSPKSLLTLSLRFSQLYIDGAQLDIRRDRQGGWHVGGIDMAGANLDGNSRAADWFFEQPEFVIRRGQVRWTDEKRGAPTLALQDTDLVLRNGLRRHDVRLDATPPAGWGSRFSLRGRFSQGLLAHAGDWQAWSGSAYADLPRVDVASLHRYLELPFDLSAGDGALRLWLDLNHGQWRDATLDLALDEVQLRLAKELEPLGLSRVQGRLRAQREAEGIRLSAQGLGFTTGDGQVWPASQAALSWRQRQDLRPGGAALPSAAVTAGDFNADRLDLALMASIAERLPLPGPMRKTLTETAPQGVVRGLRASWSGPLEQAEHYRVQARIDGLSIAARPADTASSAAVADRADAGAASIGRPGWRNADLQLDANETGGEARLTMKNGALELPGVFEEPVVDLDQFAAKLVWHISRPAKPAGQAAEAAPAIELLVQQATFANADAQGDLQARWQTGAGNDTGKGGRLPGRLELSGHIAQAQAARVARYIPLGLGPDTRSYLQQSMLSGKVSRLQFKVRGDLWEFPFQRAKDGEFRISAHLEGLDFAYVPPSATGERRWPAFSQLSGDLVIDRTSLQIQRAEGRLWGLELKGVRGQIRDMSQQATLAIDGTARGPLSDLLRFVAATPVAGWTDQGLSQAVGSGPAELKLALNIPLDEPERSTVKGTVLLSGNDLRLRPDLPPLGNVRARIEFNQRGFAVAGGQARLLGGEALIDTSSGADGSLKLQILGVASADALRRAADAGSAAQLAGLLGGQAPYKLHATWLHGQSDIVLTSPLTGMAIDLPAPLGKSADSVLPLRWQTSLVTDAATGAELRDTIHLELGGLQAEYQRDLSQDTPRVIRGALAYGAPLPSPAPGQVQATLKLGVVNADAWSAVARKLLADTASGGPSAAAGLSYAPSEIELRAQELSLGGRKLNQLVAKLQHSQQADGEHWRADLQAEQVQGQIDYRPPSPAAGSGRLHARLSRLAVAQAETVDTLFEQASGNVPALDIVVDDFELRGRKLGKLEVEANYRGSDGRDWRLSKLNLSLPEARLTGSGQWSPGLRKRVAIDFKLDLLDSGALLDRMGMSKVLRGGKGRIQGQLAWNGSPLSPDWAQTTGSMQLQLDSGQFLQADPGAARLLGVLSLQSLPRRFLLDFRDVFQQGFAFDKVSGDVQLADGIARSNNLRIRGVQALVMMEGQANLRLETQDLRMFVVPDLDAGTASLAYAAINPAIGLGTFLAQILLRKPLMLASAREFRVGGTWSEPTVDPVERKGSEPIPEFDVPAPLAAEAAASAVTAHP